MMSVLVPNQRYTIPGIPWWQCMVSATPDERWRDLCHYKLSTFPDKSFTPPAVVRFLRIHLVLVGQQGETMSEIHLPNYRMGQDIDLHGSHCPRDKASVIRMSITGCTSCGDPKPLLWDSFPKNEAASTRMLPTLRAIALAQFQQPKVEERSDESDDDRTLVDYSDTGSSSSSSTVYKDDDSDYCPSE
jgi:hypothetical protein